MKLPPAILSCQKFIPHTLEHLHQARVFPTPIPEAFYAKLIREYESVTDVSVFDIVYESDGLKVTGLLAVPATLSPQSHPLLIYNRGGSREYGKLTLISAMRSMLPFARQGYIVFASNYRGNGGGEGKEEFGGSDVNDVLNLLAIGQTHEAFDGKNTFMLGHSRGGMMTALAMKRGAVLNAAISIAGVADLQMMAKRPLMVQTVLQPLVPGYREHPEQALLKRSMLAWPEAISAPLLLLHGDADDVVPVSQSIRMSEALRGLGKLQELHTYPGGNHALVRHWDEVVTRCKGWLNQYRSN